MRGDGSDKRSLSITEMERDLGGGGADCLLAGAMAVRLAECTRVSLPLPPSGPESAPNKHQSRTNDGGLRWVFVSGT